MGRKGFTLVELIATVAIISLVFGIASYSIVGIINSSKKKSEALFVEEISDAITGYVGLHVGDLVKGNNNYIFNKCRNTSCSVKEEVSAVEMFYGSVNTYVKLSYLIDSDFFDSADFINPVNKKSCLTSTINPNVRVFRDSDYVYYYYVDLRGSNTNCDISDENAVINTLPNDLRTKVGI